MKTPIALSIIGLVAIIAFSTVGVLAYRWISAPARGAVGQREITNRWQYRIQSYEHSTAGRNSSTPSKLNCWHILNRD